MRMAFRKTRLFVAALCLLAGCLRSKAGDEDYRVYTDHPRLFLNERRLRMLKREVERQSPRWRQFEALMTGKARMAEPGFALALFSQVSGKADFCQEAVRWAQGSEVDTRQLALVFDWCQPSLSKESSEALALRLERSATEAARKPGVAAMRDRVLAAVSLAGHRQPFSEKELRFAIEKWWQGEIVPGIQHHRNVLARDETLALAEILHAVRDNLNMDLRDPIQDFFRGLPAYLLASYYPGSVESPENEFRIPASKGGGAPDLRQAALSRAGELSLVAYDANSRETQFLQGWLMRDSLLMRGLLGVTYEFLWANPYLPGLSHYHAPLFYHDEWMGRLFVRSSWEDDATWLGYFDGDLQVSTKDGVKLVKDLPLSKPVRLADMIIVSASGATSFRLDGADLRHIFLYGLRPGTEYEVRIGDAKPSRNTADPGGILDIPLEPEPEVFIRLKEVSRPRGKT